jgi:hypothetical protein
MARIVDKDTRLIDIDFGPITVNVSRGMNAVAPSTATGGLDGINQLIRLDNNPAGTDRYLGSFIQYDKVDLSMMTMNNEVMQPVEVSVQRTSPVPVGSHENGNNFTPLEEFIFVLSRPLNNNEVDDGASIYENFRVMGLDRTTSFGDRTMGGVGAGFPSHEQVIYAEKRTYAWNNTFAATKGNGELLPAAPTESYFTQPTLQSLDTWGTMSAITGPNLYCYRVVYSRVQTLPGPGFFSVEPYNGFTTLQFPPVNITFLCKDPNYTEGEYLTRLSNAMNTIPIDGVTNDD